MVGFAPASRPCTAYLSYILFYARGVFEFVDKIALSFASHLCCDCCMHNAIISATHTLLYLEKSLLDILLVENIVPFAFLAKIAIVPQPFKQLVLTYCNAILCKNFCKFPNKTA